MLSGFRKVAIAIVLTAIAGAIMGLMVGALTDEYLLWIGVMAAVGAIFGVFMGYGFLPES